LGSGGDVVAGEGNGRGREVTGGANVVLLGVRLESVPAREGGVGRMEETGAAEKIGLKNTQGLDDVTAACLGVGGGSVTEEGDVERTGNGEGKGRESEEDGDKNREQWHWELVAVTHNL